MTAEMQIIVCDTAAQVVTAKQYLAQRGYQAPNVTDEAVTTLIYDAETNDGGKADNLASKFVVIGRK